MQMYDLTVSMMPGVGSLGPFCPRRTRLKSEAAVSFAIHCPIPSSLAVGRV